MGFSEAKFIGIRDYPAEKRDMTAGLEVERVPEMDTPTRVMAERLLNPWIAGDKRRLESEMAKWREGVFTLQRQDVAEDGRGELLLCLVQQMMDEPDLFAPRSEKLHLGVWVDLLVHLAHPEKF